MADYTSSSSSSEEDEQEFQIEDAFGFGHGKHGKHGKGGRHRHGSPSGRRRPMGGPFGPGAGPPPPFGPGGGPPPPFGPGGDQPPEALHWGRERGHSHGRHGRHEHHHPYGKGGKGWGRGKFMRGMNPKFRRGEGKEKIFVFTRDFAPEELKVKLSNNQLTVTGKRATKEVADDTTEVRRESMTHVYRLPADENVDYSGIKAKLVGGGALLKVQLPKKKVQIPIERDDEPTAEMEVLDITKE